MELISIAKIITFCTLGLIAFIFFWITGSNRYYWLYTGYGLLGIGLTLFFPINLFWIIALTLTIYAFLIAILESIKETRARLTLFKKEQDEREVAFAELQKSIIEKERSKQDNKGKGE